MNCPLRFRSETARIMRAVQIREFDLVEEAAAREAAREYRRKGFRARVVPKHGYGGPFWRVKLYRQSANAKDTQKGKRND
jgi:hypothetical protein